MTHKKTIKQTLITIAKWIRITIFYKNIIEIGDK